MTRSLRTSALGLAAVLALLAGCLAERSALTGERFDPVRDTTGGRYDVDVDSLLHVLPSAAQKMHWAVARIDNQVTAARANAWTPDDRPVTITVQQSGDSRVDVHIRVGRFGDDALEAGFHEALAQAIEKQREKQRRAQSE